MTHIKTDVSQTSNLMCQVSKQAHSAVNKVINYLCSPIVLHPKSNIIAVGAHSDGQQRVVPSANPGHLN